MRWWIRLLGALLMLVLLLWLGWTLVGNIVDILNGAQIGASEPDPMFASEAELPTRPPQLDLEESAPIRPTLDDYVPDVLTPVDKTADQLIEEAQMRSGT